MWLTDRIMFVFLERGGGWKINFFLQENVCTYPTKIFCWREGGTPEPFPAVKTLGSRSQGESTEHRWSRSSFEPLYSPTARGCGQLRTSLMLTITSLYSYSMLCRSTAGIWGLSAFWMSQGSFQYLAKVLHFACLVSEGFGSSRSCHHL